MVSPASGLVGKADFLPTVAAVKDWLDANCGAGVDAERPDLRKWINNKQAYRKAHDYQGRKAFRAYCSDLNRVGGKVLAEIEQ
jgi:hypothetical protein